MVLESGLNPRRMILSLGMWCIFGDLPGRLFFQNKIMFADNLRYSEGLPIPTRISIVGTPAQGFSATWYTRKHVQERVNVSWKSRKSELVKLQYIPTGYMWGTFGCHKSYWFINLYSSDDCCTAAAHTCIASINCGDFPRLQSFGLDTSRQQVR